MLYFIYVKVETEQNNNTKVSKSRFTLVSKAAKDAPGRARGGLEVTVAASVVGWVRAQDTSWTSWIMLTRQGLVYKQLDLSNCLKQWN